MPPANLPHAHQHQEMREALRDLCARFDNACWQGVDEARGYPVEFVDALTTAGWMVALIPQEFRGSGPQPVDLEVRSPMGPIKSLKPPGVVDSFEPVMADVPALGQHTDAILAELGHSAQQITAQRAAKTI